MRFKTGAPSWALFGTLAIFASDNDPCAHSTNICVSAQIKVFSDFKKICDTVKKANNGRKKMADSFGGSLNMVLWILIIVGGGVLQLSLFIRHEGFC